MKHLMSGRNSVHQDKTLFDMRECWLSGKKTGFKKKKIDIRKKHLLSEDTLAVWRKYWLSGATSSCQEETLALSKKHWRSGGNTICQERTLFVRRKHWLSGRKYSFWEETLFTDSALWADSVYKSRCPAVCVSVCLYVCLSVCPLS